MLRSWHLPADRYSTEWGLREAGQTNQLVHVGQEHYLIELCHSIWGPRLVLCSKDQVWPVYECVVKMGVCPPRWCFDSTSQAVYILDMTHLTHCQFSVVSLLPSFGSSIPKVCSIRMVKLPIGMSTIWPSNIVFDPSQQALCWNNLDNDDVYIGCVNADTDRVIQRITNSYDGPSMKRPRLLLLPILPLPTLRCHPLVLSKHEELELKRVVLNQPIRIRDDLHVLDIQNPYFVDILGSLYVWIQGRVLCQVSGQDFKEVLRLAHDELVVCSSFDPRSAELAVLVERPDTANARHRHLCIYDGRSLNLPSRADSIQTFVDVHLETLHFFLPRCLLRLVVQFLF